jgi:hypothetical protein
VSFMMRSRPEKSKKFEENSKRIEENRRSHEELASSLHRSPLYQQSTAVSDKVRLDSREAFTRGCVLQSQLRNSEREGKIRRTREI